MVYNCSIGCGACCRRVGSNMKLLKEFGFPYRTKADGKSCEMLTDDNKCSVYRNRPDVCSVDKMFYLLHSKSGKTKKQVFLEESKICNTFIRQDGLGEKYIIDENQYK